MPKQKLEIEIDVPEGWRLVAYRPARTGEYYLINPGFSNYEKLVGQVSPNERSENRCFIVEAEEEWRPATVEDVIRILRGEKVRARFSDGGADWHESQLCGYSSNSKWPWCSTSCYWTFCKVLETEPFPC